MDIRITPNKLCGAVSIPSSKSITHRALICAALADGVSVIDGISFSEDIFATVSALEALGAQFKRDNSAITVKGISHAAEDAEIDCAESGSTLRFLIPIAAALGTESVFTGRGRLPMRPIHPYIREFSSKGINFLYDNTMPFSMGGTLKSGEFYLEGDISSQFITGLLFALPMLDGDSEIIMTSPLQSKPYADMTVDCLKEFGIDVSETAQGYFVKGGQKYTAHDYKVEGDYSQAAFFFTANALGSDIKIGNLKDKSLQGDKKILEIIEEMGYNNKSKKPDRFLVNASDIPDLVPILAVLGCFGARESVITGAQRLKIKESDRLYAISQALNSIGGKVTATDDGLVIKPISAFRGGTASSFGDHRIAMSLAIAATCSDSDVTIENAEAVSKSYPDFFEHYTNLGGIANVLNVD